MAVCTNMTAKTHGNFVYISCKLEVMHENLTPTSQKMCCIHITKTDC